MQSKSGGTHITFELFGGKGHSTATNWNFANKSRLLLLAAIKKKNTPESTILPSKREYINSLIHKEQPHTQTHKGEQYGKEAI